MSSLLSSLATNSKSALVYGYIREQCIAMNMNIIPDDCINICYLYSTKLLRIPLKIIAFRGSHNANSYDQKISTEDNGPKWLINDDERSAFSMVEICYYSQMMEDKEEDWMIFGVDDTQTRNQQSFWLKQMKIRNQFDAFSQKRTISKGVKRMKIEIGNMDDGKWKLCEMNPVVVEKGDRWQVFDVNIPYDINDKYFKISFTDNHEKNRKQDTRKNKQFVVNRLRLYGVCLN